MKKNSENPNTRLEVSGGEPPDTYLDTWPNTEAENIAKVVMVLVFLVTGACVGVYVLRHADPVSSSAEGSSAESSNPASSSTGGDSTSSGDSLGRDDAARMSASEYCRGACTAVGLGWMGETSRGCICGGSGTVREVPIIPR